MVRPIMKVHHRYSPRPADGRESALCLLSPAHRAIGDDVPGYDIHRVLTDPFPHVAGLDGPLHGLPTLCVSDALLRCCDCMVRGTSTMARQGDSIVLLAGWIHGRLDECKPVISS